MKGKTTPSIEQPTLRNKVGVHVPTGPIPSSGRSEYSHRIPVPDLVRQGVLKRIADRRYEVIKPLDVEVTNNGVNVERFTSGVGVVLVSLSHLSDEPLQSVMVDWQDIIAKLDKGIV